MRVCRSPVKIPSNKTAVLNPKIPNRNFAKITLSQNSVKAVFCPRRYEVLILSGGSIKLKVKEMLYFNRLIFPLYL